MCGIVGVVRFDGAPVDVAALRLATSLLTHRGPDDAGTWVEGPFGFGHRRLAVIDVAGSAQPMTAADGRHHVTYNGEVLNYRELRRTLRVDWRTDGDTEVLLELFAARGPDAIVSLRGQFAFAVADTATGRLWLARDRLGILPLYYHRDRGALVFASEIKALLPLLARIPDVDLQSLPAYLSRRAVPAPDTLVAGVRKLPQGHVLSVDPDGAGTPRPYWSIPSGPPEAIGAADAVRHARHHLVESVAEATVADVPVGAYLSGGLDSSLIVALLCRVRGNERVKTFAAGFGDPRVDELEHARHVSGVLGTDHHEVIVQPRDLADQWERLSWHRDAPLSEPADIAVFRLAEAAKREVTVVLSGEGSDELFAGYPKYRWAAMSRLAGLLPAQARRRIVEATEHRLPLSAHRARILLRAMGEASEEERIAAWFAPFTRAERDALLPTIGPSPTPSPWPAPRGDLVARMLHADAHAWLADNLLERGDRMSMAASLELRPPFLDHRLVEFAFGLPSSLKVRRGRTKWLVKEVARPYLPAAIVDRPKAGFRVPLDAWFRSELEAMSRDLLTDRNGFVAEVFDHRAVTQLLDRHRTGVANEDIRIWTLLALEVWHRSFARARVLHRIHGGPADVPLRAASRDR